MRFALAMVAVGLSLFSSLSQAFNFDGNRYTVYEKDLGGGSRDVYIIAKESVLILHGEISTPIAYTPNVTGVIAALYADGSLGNFRTTSLTWRNAAAQGLTLSGYKVFGGDFNGDGQGDLLLQGSGSRHSVIIADTGSGPYSYYNFGTQLNQGLVSIATRDANGDGITDVVVTGSDGFQQVAYSQPWSNSFVGLNTVAGTTGGEFRVDESGAATYSISILAPAGTAGVAPQVSLGYSSQRGNGLVGQGWSIGGLSGISRCRQTLAVDGTAKPITWTAQDRFCLDGQRLILTSGSYGAVNSTYKTEIDSFATVTAKGGSAGNPEYFEVKRKDGSVSLYGNVPGLTANKASQRTADNLHTLTWALSRFKDSAGNAIDYVYVEAGGHRISEILYAYGSSAVPGARILFGYEGRADTSSGYLAGYQFSTTYRLNKISVESSGASVREYNLQYKLTPTAVDANRASKLAGIQECVTGLCYKPTMFTWTEVQPGFFNSNEVGYIGGRINKSFVVDAQTTTTIDNVDAMGTWRPADINGDGLMDVVWEGIVYGSQHTYFTLHYALSDGAKLNYAGSIVGLGEKKAGSRRQPSAWNVIDYNNDGRQDIIIWNLPVKVFLSAPQPDGAWRISTSAHVLDFGSYGGQLSDVDGDGLTDIIQPTNDNGDQYIEWHIKYLRRDPGRPVSSNVAYKFTAPQPLTIGNPIQYSSSSLFGEGNIDFNGDGRSDLIGSSDYPYLDPLYTPDWASLPRAVYPAIAVDGGYTNAPALHTFDILSMKYQYGYEKIVDINGDGLSDILVPGYVKEGETFIQNWYYKINTGNGFLPAQIAQHVPWNGEHDLEVHSVQAVDYNQDGYQDIAWFNYANGSTGNMYVALWNGSGFGEPIVIKSGVVGGELYSHLLLDMNGDGRLDYLQAKAGGGAYFKVFPNKDQNAASNVITAVTNGLGSRTEISYEALGRTTHYQRLSVGTTQQSFTWGGQTYTFPVADLGGFYSVINGGWDWSGTGQAPLPKDKPVLELNGPMYVVTSVKSSAPRAGTQPGSVDWNAKSEIEYRYGEAKVQAAGRGFLGFHTIETTDKQSAVRTRTTYRQDFPLIGQPWKTEVFSGAGSQLAKRSVNQGRQVTSTGVDGTKYYQVYAEKVTETSWDPVTGTETSHLVTTTTPDSYGNVLSATSSVFASGDHVNPLTSVETANQYQAGLEFYGRLSRSTATHRRGIKPPVARVAEFTYYPMALDASGHLSGKSLLLRQEVIEPGNARSLTTTYDYDSFGNKTEAVRSAVGEESRTGRWQYSGNGRFLEITYGEFRNGSGWDDVAVESVQSRNALGAPLSVVDANGVVTQFSYDKFGREMMRSDSTGAWSRASYREDSLVTGAVYKIVNEVSGGGGSVVYYDVLGRSIASAKIAFDGRYSWAATEYDSSGRVRRNAQPYFAGEEITWASNEYDAFGRLKKQVVPAPSPALFAETSYAYAGLESTMTNALGQAQVEYRNAAGEVIKVVDQIGGSIEYDFDAAGQLLSTNQKDASAVQTITTSIQYDSLGRKSKMVDPDKGTWFYVHNAFGELVREYKVTSTHHFAGSLSDALQSGNGVTLQRVDMAYDRQGRLVQRRDVRVKSNEQPTDIESTTTWAYDTALRGTTGSPVYGQPHTIAGAGLSQAFVYDSFGRVTGTSQSAGAEVFLTTVTYDGIGRVLTTTDALGTGSGVVNNYNTYGYLHRVVDMGSNAPAYEVQATDARGQVTQALLGNGYTSTWGYDSRSGRLLEQKSSLGAVTLQHLNYEWDLLGNMRSRRDRGLAATGVGNRDLKQSFCYDGLNRLLKTHQGDLAGGCVLNEAQQDQRYDAFGNITWKAGIGAYTYGTSSLRPHAVSATEDGVTYSYDNNGNLLSDNNGNPLGDDRALTYTVFDKPSQITKGSHQLMFAYGANRELYKRRDTDTATGDNVTTYFLGGVEKAVKADGSYQVKRQLAGVAIWSHQFSAAGVETGSTKRYIYKDVLGSVTQITDQLGQLPADDKRRFAYDAWGQRVNPGDWSSMISAATFIPISSLVTSKGFTGHEMLDAVGIVHMGGRIYDPRLGRFLQADPFVQSPGNTQSYNRYSYVFNNPISYTDPSGYVGWEVGLAILVSSMMAGEIAREENIPWLAAVAAIASCATGNAVNCASGAFGSTYGATHDFSAALKAGAMAYVSSEAFTKIGDYFGGQAFANGEAAAKSYVADGFSWQVARDMASIGGKYALTSAQVAQQIGAHALVGGVMAELQGGKFGHGFASAGIAKGIGVSVNVPSRLGKLAVYMVAGGTASTLTGGKFANGAFTAALQYVFNEAGRWLNVRSDCPGACTSFTHPDGSKAWVPAGVAGSLATAHARGITLGQEQAPVSGEKFVGMLGAGISAAEMIFPQARWLGILGVTMSVVDTGQSGSPASVIGMAAGAVVKPPLRKYSNLSEDNIGRSSVVTSEVVNQLYPSE